MSQTIKLDVSGRVAGIADEPRPAGSLTLVEGFAVQAWKKPNRLHRWAMRLVFGWKWRDA